MEPYTWVLDRAAGREFEALEPQERRQILEFPDSLARHPFNEGHMRYRDQAGFEFRICFLGDFDVHYHCRPVIEDPMCY